MFAAGFSLGLVVGWVAVGLAQAILIAGALIIRPRARRETQEAIDRLIASIG